MDQIDFPNSLKDEGSPYHQLAQQLWDKAEAQPRTVQELRDLRTEFRENLPAGATNLDRKAANQINDALTSTYEQGIRNAGGTSEQIGAIRAIDEDYGRFQEVIKTLDPRDEKYGAKVADALFDPMTKNPGAGLEFINMAKAAERGNPGTMDKLREAFTTRALEKSSRGAAPIDQMEVLAKLNKQWGENGARAVLSGLFGKSSPWADPVLFAKSLAVPVEKKEVLEVSRFMQRVANIPWFVRLSAISAATGGSMFAATRDPTKATEAIMAVLGIGMAGKLMGRMNIAGQRAYVNWRLNPGSTENFKNFMRASGAMIGATSALPTESSPTP